jgi:pimeloyl-ACP methyl ester carboxylesterase
MHGNAGNKLEGLSYTKEILGLGIDLCTFDFSGCGNSGGDYVTLGWKEVDDLHAVLTHLKAQEKTSKVVLWGRSMGAATAMMYSKSDALPVAGLILDSGFADFKEVAKSTVLKFGIPEPFVEMLWP